MRNKKSIDKGVVEHIARLSRISLSSKEIAMYEKQLSSILNYIAKLNEVNTQNAPPTTHPLENLKNVFRKDVVKKSLSKDEALQNTPDRKDDFFSVPKIIE